MVREPALELQGIGQHRGVRAGAQFVRPALLRVRHLVRLDVSFPISIYRSAHLRSRHTVRRLCRRARHACRPRASRRGPARGLGHQGEPAAAAPTAVNWSGVYLGVNAGYSFGASNWTDSVTGAVDRQFRRLRLSVRRHARRELSGRVARLRHRGRRRPDRCERFRHLHQQSAVHGSCQTTNDWLATVRGRIGYAFDRYLVYATAGAAFGDVEAGYSEHPRAMRPNPAGPSAPASKELCPELVRQGRISVRRSQQRLVLGGLRDRQRQRSARSFPTSPSNSTKACSAPASITDLACRPRACGACSAASDTGERCIRAILTRDLRYDIQVAVHLLRQAGARQASPAGAYPT